MIRDRDRIYGAVVTRRLRAMGIRDKPIAPASPWQNGFAERLIGSIRRECLDHIIVSARHICADTISYADYTTPSERIGRCTSMRRSFVRFNDRNHSFTPILAGFTIITSGLDFSVHTGSKCSRVRRVSCKEG